MPGASVVLMLHTFKTSVHCFVRRRRAMMTDIDHTPSPLATCVPSRPNRKAVCHAPFMGSSYENASSVLMPQKGLTGRCRRD
jgi:hypothetical protein